MLDPKPDPKPEPKPGAAGGSHERFWPKAQRPRRREGSRASAGAQSEVVGEDTRGLAISRTKELQARHDAQALHLRCMEANPVPCTLYPVPRLHLRCMEAITLTVSPQPSALALALAP